MPGDVEFRRDVEFGPQWCRRDRAERGRRRLHGLDQAQGVLSTSSMAATKPRQLSISHSNARSPVAVNW